MGTSRGGIARERQVRQRLEAQGYWVCRAAGSKGDADLVALRKGSTPLLIEVKATSRGPFHSFGPAQRQELIDAATQAGATSLLIHWPSHGTERWYWGPDEWPKTKTP